MPSDSINEQRCGMKDCTAPHYFGPFDGWRCPGPPVITPPAQDEQRGQFRKRPVVIEARQWMGGDYGWLDDWLGNNWGRADAHDVAWDHEDSEQVAIYNSLEKVWIPVPVGHWIIQGVRGEFYPCEPSTFRQTYVPAAPSMSTDPEKVRAQALHEAILAVHNSRFYEGQPDCNYHGVRNAERVLREQLGAQLNYPAHTCESADTGHTPKKERTMRDILAALLRSRGYTHDDEADPYDMHWHHDALGVRPILACVAQEMNGDLGRPTPGWGTYEVSVAR